MSRRGGARGPGRPAPGRAGGGPGGGRPPKPRPRPARARERPAPPVEPPRPRRTVIYGVHPVQEALRGRRRVHRIWATEAGDWPRATLVPVEEIEERAG